MCMSLVFFDRRHLVHRARALTAAVGGSFLPTVRNSFFRRFRSGQRKKLNETAARSDRAGHQQLHLGGGVTRFGSGSGDSTPPCQDSNSAATTSNPRPRTGRMSASLETTVAAGESLTGEPLRNPLPAKQRSSLTRPRWVGACASSDPYLKGSKLLSVRKICSCSGLA